MTSCNTNKELSVDVHTQYFKQTNETFEDDFYAYRCFNKVKFGYSAEELAESFRRWRLVMEYSRKNK